jgi:GAF domain-containing protein
VAYGFYHAQVFLLDAENRMARLEASTGRAGQALLARGHALAVGSQSVVGQAAVQAEPVVVNDTAWSRIHSPNELLPDTRAELALPLLVEGRVIGIVDVQSTRPDVFQDDDVRSLQVLAAQLAAAVEKARLVDELQIRATENERLFEDAQRSLLQIEDLNRRLTREGWSDYLRARRTQSTLGYTLQGEDIRADGEWTAPMKQAYQGESSVVVRQDQSAQIAALPVRVRGEVIGVLEIERDGKRPWTDGELELIDTLVDRLALAVENARLYEQATEAVEREQLVNRIAQDVQEASSIDEVLQAALTELSEVLGASRGVVQISPKVQPVSGPGQSAPGSGA